MQATHDLFLSYRWADAPAVECLVAALDALGVRVWRDAREVEDLASIQTAVATGLANARALLAWYSSRYNESRACQWELTSAYVAAQVEGDPRLRILVVNPESGNTHVYLPELFDQLHLSGAGVPDDAAAVQALAERIKEALGRLPETPLGALRSLAPPQWIPAMGTGSTRFVGRLREMWQLHGALHGGRAAMLTGTGGKAGLALVQGAGGIGKSLMAEEYALRFGAAYSGGVFWLRGFGHPDGGQEIDAGQRINLRDAQLVDIAARLGIDTSKLNPAQVQGALTKHFAQQAQPFLWVVDDLPSDPGPEGLGGWQAPHPLGCTLFTTRTRRFAHILTIELPQLDEDDAVRLLTRRRLLSSAEDITARAICILLGHHALAVDVTAALVDRRGLIGVQDALKRPGSDALALAAQLDEALPNGHQRQIAATFLDSIQQLDEPARDLLRYASVLAVAPIPTQLLVDVLAGASRASSGKADPADARDQADLAISQLLSNSLVEDAGADAINVHTLVSRTVRFAESSPKAGDILRSRVVRALTSEMVNAGDIRRHAHLGAWVTHARYVTESLPDLDTADLLGWVARFDLERGNYVLAMQGYKRELALRKRVQGKQHPDTLTVMSCLATSLSFQGDLSGAKRLHEAVLRARKQTLGPEHPDTLTSMHNLARALYGLGDLPRAKRLQKTVVRVRKRVLGPEHTDTLMSMGNLASILSDQGDVIGARRLEEALLEVRERVQGPEHPETLMAMNNLALTLVRQGDLLSARWLQETAFEAIKRVQGEEHPYTLILMDNLGQTLSEQGELIRARQLQEASLEAQERLLGPEHPNTLTTMTNLARTLYRQVDLTGARRLVEAALEAQERVLGREHPNTLTSMADLAITLWHQGEVEAARQLQGETTAGFLHILGAAHVHTTDAQRILDLMQTTLPDKPRQAKA
jgi:hypothetical protein